MGPSARGSGRRSNFSISGKEISTTGFPLLAAPSIISGRRCSVCGPNTTSTNGARRAIPSPSWLATQPPTPMLMAGFFSFSARQRPSWENTFSCAFSRMEQVFTSNRSASSGVPVQLVAMRLAQDVRHLVRVVLVHLAAHGLDVQLFAHNPDSTVPVRLARPRVRRMSPTVPVSE